MDWATNPEPQMVAVKKRKNDCLSWNIVINLSIHAAALRNSQQNIQELTKATRKQQKGRGLSKLEPMARKSLVCLSCLNSDKRLHDAAPYI